ncbi:hypothetical protein PFDG_04051 [Plasmodium falciparum Dd2]|uniref:Uncharacterized protein n=1 Tax=Plasmodium falciparum (isolate Dd2) TaxID=57267 RepID=A0A0L7M8U0_PLAF4|nr:hypothetical protein PFDG_04051 [Plasmodium falciparum Dd2]
MLIQIELFKTRYNISFI